MVPPGSENKVMHAAFKVGDTQIMASDGHCAGKPSFQGFGLTLNAANDAEADKLFNAVGKGGQVQVPLGKTFFASKFGMVTDKFGVLWMVIAEKPELPDIAAVIPRRELEEVCERAGLAARGEQCQVFSTLALRSGTPNSRRQTSASTATPCLMVSGSGLAKQRRSRHRA